MTNPIIPVNILSIRARYLLRRTDNMSLDNTVPFMKWVVIENTFVIIGASTPLIRPLFTRSRSGDQSSSAYPANASYEMNPTHKSTMFQTSSEENILPIHGGPLQATNIESSNSLGSEQETSGEGIQKKVSVQVKYEEG